MVELRRVRRFARKHGYWKVIFVMEWKGMHCYDPRYIVDLHMKTGVPEFILVDPESGEMHLTDSDETFEIFDVLYGIK